MSTYQEHNMHEHAQNSYIGYAGYTSQSPSDSYNTAYEQLNNSQQQAYQEPLNPYRDEPPYQQQDVPPTHNQCYTYHTPGTASHLNTRPRTTGSFAAGLCYLGFWLTGLLFLLFERKNRLIRFHAMQSLLFFGGVTVLYFFFLRIIIDQVPLLWGFAIFAFVIMNIIAAVSWFVGLIGAFSGKYTKLPFVGDIAERYVNRTTPTNPHQI